MKRGVWGIAVLALAFLFAASIGVPALAQNQRMGGGMDHEMMGDNEQQQEMMERMHSYRMWRLIEELDLSDKQITEVRDIMNDQREERQEVMKLMRERMDVLRTQLKRKTPNDEVLAETIGELRKLKERLDEAMEDHTDRLQDVLTVEQQAKYILFNQEFPQQMRQMMKMHGMKDDKMGDMDCKKDTMDDDDMKERRDRR